MALKKLCPKCGKLIDAGQRYCNECTKKYEARQKERYKKYDNKRKSNKSWRFYSTNEWRKVRQYINIKYKGLCLWSYYIEHRIVQANAVHHIIPIEDDYSKRLEIDNLIPLTDMNHRYIHELYKKDKARAQERLRFILNEWNKQFAR